MTEAGRREKEKHVEDQVGLQCRKKHTNTLTVNKDKQEGVHTNTLTVNKDKHEGVHTNTLTVNKDKQRCTHKHFDSEQRQTRRCTHKHFDSEQRQTRRTSKHISACCSYAVQRKGKTNANLTVA